MIFFFQLEGKTEACHTQKREAVKYWERNRPPRPPLRCSSPAPTLSPLPSPSLYKSVYLLLSLLSLPPAPLRLSYIIPTSHFSSSLLPTVLYYSLFPFLSFAISVPLYLPPQCCPLRRSPSQDADATANPTRL